jgi:plasmid maintenance system antidote protein VapI
MKQSASMENIMMRYCRDTQKQTAGKVATVLGISLHKYKQLEAGKTMMTAKQARQLEKLFNVKAHYFYQAALQLDLLRTTSELVIMQKQKIRELEQKVKELQAKTRIKN